MSVQTLRHRHAVFLPLFLAVCTLSSIPLSPKPIEAQVQTRFIAEDKEVKFATDTVHGQLEPGTSLEVREDGSIEIDGKALVIASEGLFELHVQGAQIAGLHGALHIIATTKALTVSALTSPAYIVQGDTRVVVPVGYSWKGDIDSLPELADGYDDWIAARDVTLLPQHFVREQLRKLRTDSAYTYQEGEALSALTQIDDRPVVFAALSELLPQENLWMLTSLHPAYRSMAWTYGEAQYPTEARLLRLLRFPYLDGSVESVDAFTFERYRRAVREAAHLVELPQKFLERFSAHLLPLVEQMRTRGYPERALMLQELARDVLDGYEEVLTEDTQRALLQTETDFTKPVTAVETKQPKAVQEFVPTMDDTEATRLTYAALRESGALFTVHTDVEAHGERVLVSDILYAGRMTDHTVQFTYNARTQQVTTIEVDGKSYPFHMDFSAFTEWLTQS